MTKWHIKVLRLILCCILLTFALNSCVVTPFSNAVSGRSIGKSHSTITAGYVYPKSVYYRQSYGVTNALDIGGEATVGINSLIGVNAKYSFINKGWNLNEKWPSPQPGWALAGLANAGWGSMSSNHNNGHSDQKHASYISGGGIVSYSNDGPEYYLLALYNHINFNHTANIPVSWNFGQTINSDNFYQLTAGTTIWAFSSIGFTINYTRIIQPHKSDGFVAGGFILHV